MTISRDLFLAILALDSYNRGYSPGLQLSGNQLGLATVTKDDFTEDERSLGFYATSYNWNGEKVISYRGTDNLNPLAGDSDIWRGWSIGLGWLPGTQAGMAMDYYKGVTDVGWVKLCTCATRHSTARPKLLARTPFPSFPPQRQLTQPQPCAPAHTLATSGAANTQSALIWQRRKWRKKIKKIEFETKKSGHIPFLRQQAGSRTALETYPPSPSPRLFSAIRFARGSGSSWET